jgi:hypothetical protein
LANIIDLNTFAEGAFAERFNAELRKVLENIADPNTDPKKARKVTMTVTLKGDEERDLSFVNIQGKASLAPARDVQTKIILDRDRYGKVTGAELKSGIKGQTFIDHEGDVAEDTGRKIVGFNKKTN